MTDRVIVESPAVQAPVSNPPFSPCDVAVEKGQILLVDEGEGRGWRYKLWAVSSVRKTARGASVKLLGWSPGCLAEASATFPDGLVKEPWQVFALNQRDLGLVWNAGLTPTTSPKSSPDSAPSPSSPVSPGEVSHG